MAIDGTKQQITHLLRTQASDENGLRGLTTRQLEAVAQTVAPDEPARALQLVRQVRDALIGEASAKTEAVGAKTLTKRLRTAATNRGPKFQASKNSVPLGPWSVSTKTKSEAPAIALDGGNLSLDQLHAFMDAPRGAKTTKISIGATGQNNINRSNELLDGNRANPDELIYGIDTGFGIQKDAKQKGDAHLREFQLRQLLSHNVALGEELPDAIVKTAMLLRVNAMASGHLAGNSLELAERYATVLSLGLTPVARRVGGLGMGDLPTNTAIGLAAIGHPAAELKRPDGTVGPADVVLKEYGIEPTPMTLAPGEGLAVMSGTSTVTAGMVYAEHKIQGLVDRLETSGHKAGAQQLREALDDARSYAGVMLKQEINAASGSPLAFENEDGKLEVKSGGNWSEAMLGVSMDHLNAVLTASMHVVAESEDQKDLLDDMRENAAQSSATALGQSTQGGQEDTPTMAFASLNNLLDQLLIADQIVDEVTPSDAPLKKHPVSEAHVVRADAVKERFARLSRLLDGASALYFEADFALEDSFNPNTHDARGVPGQIVSAQNITELRKGSQFVDDPKKRVQDAVVHRATPDIHGAAHAANAYVAGRDRMNDAFKFSSALDHLGRVTTQAAVASERRTGRLITAQWNHGLPTYLSGIDGAEAGLAQVSAAATAHLVEMRQATGSTIALRGGPKTQKQADRLTQKSLDKIEAQLDRAEVIIAAEILTALQGIDLRVKQGEAILDDLGEGTKALYDLVRGPEAQRGRPVEDQIADGFVPFIAEDRDLQLDLKTVIDIVKDGKLDAVLRTLGRDR